MSRRLRSALVAGILLTSFGQIKAALINAKSVSLADISSSIASAHDGDTVLVPPGTASWTSTLSIKKGITLQGAGNDTTVILDDIPRPERRERGRGERRPEGQGERRPEGAGERRPEGAGERQVEASRQRQLERQRQQQLQGPRHAPHLAGSWPLPDRAGPPGGSNGTMLRIELTPRQSFRLTGCTFKYGSMTTNAVNGSISTSGTSPSFRLDHCHFDQLYTDQTIQMGGCIFGVIDHCTFDIRKGPIVRVYHQTWGNQPSGWGSWADPPYFGSEKFIFIEDNVINNLAPSAPNFGGIDATHGGRYVARHNSFNNCNIFYHGTDNGNGGVWFRGTRAVEIYNNTFKATRAIGAGHSRSGPLIWHDNTYTGPYGAGMRLMPYRQFEFEGSGGGNAGWGGANGANPWDYNATEPDGTHVDGHAPYLYATGTHTGENNSTTITVSGTPWRTDQWFGYSVTNTSSASPYFNGHNYISSNTSNTLTLPGHGTVPPLPKFNTGDTFAIHKVLIILDQPGRGKGDLIVGNPQGATNLSGSAWPAWPHQALEPCYSWNNTLNGLNLDFSNNDSHNILRENRDYYNQTNSFDGTVGIGVGTLANRPSTCTPGVAYWATDQGEGDRTHSGPGGQLYVCTAPNTWTLKYKPYVYPHPLTTAGAKSRPDPTP